VHAEKEEIVSVSEIHTKTLPEALAELEALASDDSVVFRGHSNVSWRLGSTLARYSTVPHRPWDTLIDELLSHFMNGLASVGQLPSRKMDRRARLEFGRNYGVPSPLIDFTLSPYVALFFAFDGIRPEPTKPDEEVVVYALALTSLAVDWAKRGGSFDSEYSSFMYEREDMFPNGLFPHGYPAGILKFIRFPASWNTRMLRQMGAFLYDTLDYRLQGKLDLEDFITAIQEPAGVAGKPSQTLVKVFIPKSIASNVFSRLELMGMTGARLMDDHVGAAADVYNSYNYNRRTGYTWDLLMPPPDDAMM